MIHVQGTGKEQPRGQSVLLCNSVYSCGIRLCLQEDETATPESHPIDFKPPSQIKRF